MPTTVRLPDRVEEALAQYCVGAQRTKSEVIIELLTERFLSEEGAPPIDSASASGFLGCVELDADASTQLKARLKEKLRAKHTR